MHLPSRRSALRIAFAALTLWAVGSCASLPLVGSRQTDQMTAAITDVRESTPDRLILSTERLEPFRLSPDGASEPEVEARGHHDPAWVDAMVSQALIDGTCEGSDCEPSSGTQVIAVSEPYRGRTGAFVDGRIQTLLGSGGATVIQTRFVRFQIEDESAGWRVVASTPLWETVG